VNQLKAILTLEVARGALTARAPYSHPSPLSRAASRRLTTRSQTISAALRPRVRSSLGAALPGAVFFAGEFFQAGFVIRGWSRQRRRGMVAAQVRTRSRLDVRPVEAEARTRG
jgi:hypothetical protein